MTNHLSAVILAILLDKLIGDPRWMPHPVRGIGWLISKLDSSLNKGEFLIVKGTLTAFLTTIIPFMVALLIVTLSYQFHSLLGVFIEAILIFFTIAQKSLADAAKDVYTPLNENRLEDAREKLGWIVGRDTANLEEREIVRGVVETVAENISDGVTAPIFYAILGGAPLAVFYRAVNTLDSMLGYKNEKYLLFGRASAKWDDWMNYAPSRLTSICMILSSFRYSNQNVTTLFHILRRDARKHPSPNSGFGETAMAALLGVQLGGVNTYKGLVSIRPKMGDPNHQLRKHHILTSIRIMHQTVILFLILLVGGALFYGISSTWS